MGLNYGFEIIAPLAAAGRLLESLAAHLAPDDGGRLLALREVPVEHWMARVRRESHEHCGDLCLAFLFEPDGLLVEHGGIEGLADPGGRVALGCLWSTFRCGRRYLQFKATAASSGISRLCAESVAVRDAFARIGVEAGACLVGFDDEQGGLHGIWPRSGHRHVAVADDGAPEFQVDPWCAAVLRAFGLPA